MWQRSMQHPPHHPPMPSSPQQPTPHTLPVPLCLISQEDCNWRRSIGGWGQEKSYWDFQNVHAGLEEEMALPPNTQFHVITIIQLEDGLFHFIITFALSCLIRRRRGVTWAVTGTMWNRYLVPLLNAFFLSFHALQELNPWTIIFS